MSEMTSNQEPPTTIAQYLIQELRDRCGIKHIFGVPGDFSFPLNDAIAELKFAENEADRVHWVGNLNELNASYAAEGYSRINGYGAICTTYMVGELSAINGVAGCFAANVPVFHMVGMPSSNKFGTCATDGVHHTMGPEHGSPFAAFEAASKVTSNAVALKDGSTDYIMSTIDALIDSMIFKKKPVYLAICVDLAKKPITGVHRPNKATRFRPVYHGDRMHLLRTKDLEEDTHPKISSMTEFQARMEINRSTSLLHSNLKGENLLEATASSILKKMSYVEGADKIAVIALGAHLKRLDPAWDSRASGTLCWNIHRLIDQLRVPIVEFSDNKGVISGNHPLNLGILGSFVPDNYSQAMELYAQGIIDTSRILAIGCNITDMSPGIAEISKNSIQVNLNTTRIGGTYHDAALEKVVEEMTRILLKEEHEYVRNDSFKPWPQYPNADQARATRDLPPTPSNGIDYQTLTRAIADNAKDGDLVYSDIGTIIMALACQRFTTNIRYECNTLWCSIGHATPGAHGAAIAMKNSKNNKEGRVFMVTGEGSHMMTIQSIADSINHSHMMIPVTYLVIDNAGYTIERLLCDTDEKINKVYNDLPALDYPKLFDAFGGFSLPEERQWVCKTVSTKSEVNQLLEETSASNKSAYITLKMDPMEAPEPARYLAKVLYGKEV